jgi:lysyl-tRNA synthetase class 2
MPHLRGVDDRARAASIIRRYGTDTLANFALRPDRSYCFAASGEALVPYVTIAGFAMAPGGPVGAPGHIDAALDAFELLCARHRWRPVYLSVPDRDLHRYQQRGFRHFYFGDEAIVRIDSFALAGKRNKSIRQSVGRIGRDHRLEVVPESRATLAQRTELERVSARWRAGAPERSFSMATGKPVGEGPRDAELFVAVREDGVVGGFLRVLPVPGDPRAFTLDAMRRDPHSPNGMTEFLVAETVEVLRRRGADRFSVNFAVMARLYRDEHVNTRGDRVLLQFFRPFNRFFPFRSLYEFNRRFRPEWLSRVLVYRSHAQLPFITVLYFGLEGYLSLPVVGRWFAAERLERRRVTPVDPPAAVIDLRDEQPIPPDDARTPAPIGGPR